MTFLEAIRLQRFSEERLQKVEELCALIEHKLSRTDTFFQYKYYYASLPKTLRYEIKEARKNQATLNNLETLWRNKGDTEMSNGVEQAFFQRFNTFHLHRFVTP